MASVESRSNATIAETIEELLPFYSESSVNLREMVHNQASDGRWRWRMRGAELAFCTPSNVSAGLHSTVPPFFDASQTSLWRQTPFALLLLGLDRRPRDGGVGRAVHHHEGIPGRCHRAPLVRTRRGASRDLGPEPFPGGRGATGLGHPGIGVLSNRSERGAARRGGAQRVVRRPAHARRTVRRAAERPHAPLRTQGRRGVRRAEARVAGTHHQHLEPDAGRGLGRASLRGRRGIRRSHRTRRRRT